jgi:hypothetical protein
MNTNLSSFLKLLTDLQLAYFYKYRYEEFMDGSKNKIVQEFQSRNIAIENITNMISRKPNFESGSCARCGSKYFETSNVQSNKYAKGISAQVDSIQSICQVCGQLN